MGNTILIAEADKAYLLLLAGYFRKAGFTVHTTRTCAEALKLTAEHKPDCFLLACRLADASSAIDICRYVRLNRELRKNPIVILSEDPKQAIYTYTVCQADAFMEKGRALLEILAVIRRHLRRGEWERGIFSGEDFTLEAATLRMLRPGHEPISLTPEQFRFLSLLVSRSPDFVPEDDLCSYVCRAVCSQPCLALSSLAYRLRKKLGPQLSRRIKSMRNRGWIYVQPRVHRRPRKRDLQEA